MLCSTGLRRILCLCVLFPLSVLAQTDSPPAVRQIFLGHTNHQAVVADTAAAAAGVFREQVNELSQGRLRVEIVPDGVLGGNRETAALVEKGTIHSAIVTPGGVATQFPPLNVFYLPYAFSSSQHARRVMDGPFGLRLGEAMAEQTPLKLLGLVDAPGFQLITNSRREISTPEQLSGLKFRTIPGAKLLEAMFRAIGAKPVKVGSREELSALGAGVIDGQMNSSAVILSRGIDTVQKYATVSKHAYFPYIWVFNRAAFDQLPAEDQAIIQSAARIAIERAHRFALAQENSDQGISGLRRRMKVRDLSAAEQQRFQQAMQPAVEKAIAELLGESGATWLAAFKRAL